MAVRRRGNRWSVEVYDASRKSRKLYVGTHDTQREAREAEREAEPAIAQRRGRPGADETVASFEQRWLDLRPRQKASTNQAYREQVKPFVAAYGDRRLRDVDIELAYSWLRDKRWTHGGVRAMFSDARRLGLVESNPFAGLRLRGSRGRKDVVPLTVQEVRRLADCAGEVWTGEVALTVRALILTGAFVGMRPGEMYGLRWSDLGLPKRRGTRRPSVLARVAVVRTPEERTSPCGRPRSPAREALLALPRPVDREALIFRARRGGPLNGRTQHYYWHPVRCRFGNPSLDFYELRHFCASWLFNDLELPAQDVAHQLGHTDGGALVQRLYGHPSERLARERIKRAVGGSAARVVQISEAGRRQAES